MEEEPFDVETAAKALGFMHAYMAWGHKNGRGADDFPEDILTYLLKIVKLVNEDLKHHGIIDHRLQDITVDEERFEANIEMTFESGDKEVYTVSGNTRLSI